MPSVHLRLRAFFQRIFFRYAKKVEEKKNPDAGRDHRLLLSLTSVTRLPVWRQWRYAIRVLSPSERRAGTIAGLVFILALGTFVGSLIRHQTVDVPSPGGTFTEGLVGAPKYLNPLDAPANDVDRDLSSLIYSGLFRMNGLVPEPDLASSYTWSDDGRTLTITLREDAHFHNGDSVTSKDVEFTVDSVQDPRRGSPSAPYFRGVHVTAVDPTTVRITLDHPDATLLSALTIGILPSRLWQDIAPQNARLADLNTHPTGSGPYRFKSFLRDSLGNIRSYTFERSEQYYGNQPSIKTLVFTFFLDRGQAEDALKADLIDALAFVNTSDVQMATSNRWHHVELDLPQETVAFFNLRHKPLNDNNVREALAGVVDRPTLVNAWNGHATMVNGPFPFMNTSSTTVELDRARQLLDQAGWVIPTDGNVRVLKPKVIAPAKPKTKRVNGKTVIVASAPAPVAPSTSSTELALTISTTDQPELLATAEALKLRWSLIGVKVTVQTLSPDDLLRRATRDAQSDIILTNILLGPEQDLFPFWSSGQAIEHGLNISHLIDRDVDVALDRIRNATSTAASNQAQIALSQLLIAKNPAAFLVRPRYLYLVSERIHGVNNLLTISSPADRFQGLMQWYIKTSWRWK